MFLLNILLITVGVFIWESRSVMAEGNKRNSPLQCLRMETKDSIEKLSDRLEKLEDRLEKKLVKDHELRMSLVGDLMNIVAKLTQQSDKQTDTSQPFQKADQKPEERECQNQLFDLNNQLNEQEHQIHNLTVQLEQKNEEVSKWKDCHNVTDDINQQLHGKFENEHQMHNSLESHNRSENDTNEGRCAPLTRPKHGSILFTALNHYNTTARYSCDSKFKLLGKREIKCESNGLWRGTAPKCVYFECGSNVQYLRSPATILYNSDKYTNNLKDCYVVQSSSPFTVEVESMDIEFNFDGQGHITCHNDYIQYITNDGVAQSKICGKAGDDVPNLTVTDGELTVMFRTNHKETNGGFSIKIYTPDCGLLPPPPNGTVTIDNTQYGGQALYNLSYSAEYLENCTRYGDLVRTCQVNGSWSGAIPGCVKDCRPLDIVFVVEFTERTNFETTQTFINNLIDKFTIGSDQVNVGFIRVASAASDTFNFTLETYNDKNTLKSAISNVSFAFGGFNIARGRMMRKTHFKVENGNRLGILDVAIVLTDYKYHLSQHALQEATASKQHGITIFAIGIGSDIDEKEIRKLSKNSTFFLPSSNDTLVKEVTNAVFAKLCKENTSAYGDCGPLPPPTNGRVTIDKTTYGGQALYNFSHSAEYNCTVYGDLVRTCQANGSWNGTTPGCLCTSGCIRLKNVAGMKRYERYGRLEVMYDGIWGTVCGDDFDAFDAIVACRQLGYGSYTDIDKADDIFRGIGQIWLDDLICTGQETDLSQCGKKDNTWGSHNCKHHEDVLLGCS